MLKPKDKQLEFPFARKSLSDMFMETYSNHLAAHLKAFRTSMLSAAPAETAVIVPISFDDHDNKNDGGQNE